MQKRRLLDEVRETLRIKTIATDRDIINLKESDQLS